MVPYCKLITNLRHRIVSARFKSKKAIQKLHKICRREVVKRTFRLSTIGKNMTKGEISQKNPVCRNEHTFVKCNINANPSNPVPQTNSTIISTKRILYSSQSFKRLSLLLYFSELNYVFSYLNVRSVPDNVSSYF